MFCLSHFDSLREVSTERNTLALADYQYLPGNDPSGVESGDCG